MKTAGKMVCATVAFASRAAKQVAGMAGERRAHAVRYFHYLTQSSQARHSRRTGGLTGTVDSYTFLQ